MRNEVFSHLKHALFSSPILAFPDFHIPFHLTTDTSDNGLGAVLQQEYSTGRKRVIACASRSVSPTEAIYSVTELEALAVVWCLKHFRYLILDYDIVVASMQTTNPSLGSYKISICKENLADDASPFRRFLPHSNTYEDKRILWLTP